MPRTSANPAVTTVLPLTLLRWPDLLQLFGPRGACAGCWCQYWRMPHADWRRAEATVNRAALEAQARSSRPPGLLGYDATGTAVGWISLGLRKNSPGLRDATFFVESTDEPGLWSIVCFYVPRKFRRRGVAEALLTGAVAHARRSGARVLEAYPWDLDVKATTAAGLYTGMLPLFLRAGFSEVTRRVPHRPIVRLTLR
jgi:ribosomal protein S18 acetylase RimI-like enzyme